MNYYEEIKTELINNEIYKKVKDYSKNRSDLNTYYNVGKLLSEAGKHYGEGIIKKYSLKLTSELGKGYSTRTLKYMRNFYNYQKGQPLAAELSWSHYTILLSLKTINEINYYIKICLSQNLSKRELITRIKSKEYERLDESTKNKLINQETIEVSDFIKNPIVIKNKDNIDINKVSEKMLKQMILENIEDFMKELGNSFSFIGSEYKIKIESTYNYIDLLLFNYEYNSFIVVELKVTEFKVEYISQVQKYMNYIDKNVKEISNNSTIGILICKRENKFVIEYCSDERIVVREYELV